jgi:hypothetical protein
MRPALLIIFALLCIWPTVAAAQCSGGSCRVGVGRGSVRVVRVVRQRERVRPIRRLFGR